MDQLKDRHLKGRYKLRLNDYVETIKKEMTKVRRPDNDVSILENLVKDLKDKIDNLWVEGCPFNIQCQTRTLDGRSLEAKKFCKSDGTMECSMHFLGSNNETLLTNPDFKCSSNPTKHEFNPYKTRIERSLLRFFILDHM